MKIFRDNICYVDYFDLARYPVPLCVGDEIRKQNYISNDLIVLRKPESVDYIKKREDIIDYDDVSILGKDELEKMFTDSFEQLKRLAKIELDTPYESRRRLYLDKEFKKKYDICKYRTQDLLKYKNNKKVIDERILKGIENDSSCEIKYRVTL